MTCIPDAVDLRDWSGLDLEGNNDNSSIIQAAIDQAAYPDLARVVIPKGRIGFSAQIVVQQGTWLDGLSQADRGSELWYFGADGVDAIVNPDGVTRSWQGGTSYLKFSRIALRDKRVNPSNPSRGMSLYHAVNYVRFDELFIKDFPGEQLYIGAVSGKACDCIHIDDIWVTANDGIPNARGILIERADNFVLATGIKSDLATPLSEDGYVFRTNGIPNDGAVVNVTGLKHEGRNNCPTISLPGNTHGNIELHSVVQRNPAGAQHAGDVVRLGTQGVPYSEGNRITLENITGFNHSDWTGATGAAVVNCLANGQKSYGHIYRGQVGASGRLQRQLAGNGSPEGSVFGNPGDTYAQLDSVASGKALWTKRSQAGQKTGWVGV